MYFLPAATKLGQGNIFTSVCQEFCPKGGRVSASVHAGIYTPQTRQTPPRPGRHPTPPGPGRHPRTRQTPPRTRQTTPPRPGRQPPPDQADPPGPGRPPPPPEADSRIRSTSGRYTSYWNAFLFSKRIWRISVLSGTTVTVYLYSGLLVTSALGFKVRVQHLLTSRHPSWQPVPFTPLKCTI